MLKKMLSLILSVLLVFSLAALAFATDGVQEGEPAPSADPVIRFDTSSIEWTGFTYVGFHIWSIDDESFTGYDWGGKKQRGIEEGNGIWSYDLASHGLTLTPGKQYAVIFYTDTSAQTYNLLFDTTCFGDAAYGDASQILENPEDSNKVTLPAYWRNQDPAVNGPELKITSIGNVVGSCVPRCTSRTEMLEDFLKNTLENARAYSELSDQELIDNAAAGLGLSADATRSVIAASGVETEWSYDASALDKDIVDPTEYASVHLRGDADGDGSVTILDATRIQRWLAKLTDDSGIDLVAADCDGDGAVTVLDATRIQRVLAKLCDIDGKTPADPFPGGSEYELPIL